MAYHLFEVVGIEIEYMIADRGDLRVRPIADELIRDAHGAIESEIERGALAWSNELALHVIELKTNGPARGLDGLAGHFQDAVREINALLEPRGAMLLPGGMHPTMDPEREMRLWPHDYSPVYEQFNRIFDCRGHGWSNLQSVHINLPFADDAEFGRLHAAIRFLLPLLPALAASSPIAEGKASGWLDTRLMHYRHNARLVPSVSGQVIPEPLYTRGQYEEQLLGRIYADLAPLDPEGILRHEWVNARGAIARFDRSAIEIRVLDVNECPRSDLAIAALICAALRELVAEHPIPYAAQQRWASEPLAAIWQCTAQHGDRAPIHDPEYLRAWGLPAHEPRSAGALWQHIAAACRPRLSAQVQGVLRAIAEQGCLARRIEGRLAQGEPLPELYRELAQCLARGELFAGPPAAAHL